MLLLFLNVIDTLLSLDNNSSNGYDNMDYCIYSFADFVLYVLS